MIKIVQLSTATGVYGAERWILTLLKYLDASQFHSQVVTVGTKPGTQQLCTQAAQLGYASHHINLGGRVGWRAILALRRLLRDEQAAIVHSHGFKSDFLALLATLGTGVVRVSTPHGWSDQEGWLIGLYERLDRGVLRLFHAVYPVSSAITDSLWRGTRANTITNAVDVGHFAATRLTRAAQKSGAREALQVLYVGRLVRSKGVFDLLAAFAQFAQQRSGTLRFIGTGSDQAELQQQVTALGLVAQTEFVGYVDDVRPAFAQADVLVLPSYSEGTSRVVMEAFSAELPVIGSDIEGNRRLLKPDYTGTLVPITDAAALSAALLQCADDPLRVKTLAESAYAFVTDHFGAKAMARRYQGEYQRLVSTSLE